MLNSPDGRSNIAFTGYAYQCQQIEDFIDRLAEADDPNDPEVQRKIAEELDIPTESLDFYDVKYIESEVARRRW
jgi:hypothetical protein